MQNRQVGKGAVSKSYCALFLTKDTKNGFENRPVTAEDRQEIRQMLKAGRPDLLAIGTPGGSKAASLLKETGDKREEILPSWLLEEAAASPSGKELLPGIREALRDADTQSAVIFPASDKGIFGALWEMGEALMCGIEADLMRIPMKQSVIEVLECYGLNPYEEDSDGVFLLVCRDGSEAERLLKEAGIPAALMGKLTAKADRVLYTTEGVRYLNAVR